MMEHVLRTSSADAGPSSGRRAIPSLRWWIGAILFASTAINYIDRQTLSLLAPYLKQDFHWTNTDYANIVVAFRVAYSIGQTVCGGLMDRVGTKRGLTITVLWYSIVSILTPLGFLQFSELSLSAGRGRIRQLASRDESGFGMVSQARTRVGHGGVRQRFFNRWCDRSDYYPAAVFPVGNACGICDPRLARTDLVGGVALALLPSRGASANQRGGVEHNSSGHAWRGRDRKARAEVA
jgi:MFS family permease